MDEGVKLGWFLQRRLLVRQSVDHAPPARDPDTQLGWGYVGTGPLQLSASLLAEALGERGVSSGLIRMFTFDVVAHLSEAGWQLTDQDVKEWSRLHANLRAGDERECPSCGRRNVTTISSEQRFDLGGF